MCEHCGLNNDISSTKCIACFEINPTPQSLDEVNEPISYGMIMNKADHESLIYGFCRYLAPIDIIKLILQYYNHALLWIVSYDQYKDLTYPDPESTQVAPKFICVYDRMCECDHDGVSHLIFSYNRNTKHFHILS